MTQLFPGGYNDLQEISWEVGFYFEGKKFWSSEELERTFRKILDGIDIQIEPHFESTGELKHFLLKVTTNKPFNLDEVKIKGIWKGQQFAFLDENLKALTLGKDDTLTIQINLKEG